MEALQCCQSAWHQQKAQSGGTGQEVGQGSRELFSFLSPSDQPDADKAKSLPQPLQPCAHTDAADPQRSLSHPPPREQIQPSPACRVLLLPVEQEDLDSPTGSTSNTSIPWELCPPPAPLPSGRLALLCPAVTNPRHIFIPGGVFQSRTALSTRGAPGALLTPHCPLARGSAASPQGGSGYETASPLTQRSCPPEEEALPAQELVAPSPCTLPALPHHHSVLPLLMAGRRKPGQVPTSHGRSRAAAKS